MRALLIALLAFAPSQGKSAKSIDADWNQYRGPKRDGLSPDTGLLKEWPSAGPPLAWKAKGLGSGYSSVCVAKGRVYTMGEADGAYNLYCLNAADGKIVWASRIAKSGDVPYPGTRATPATDGTLVYAISPLGDLVCVQAATGREVWRKSFDGPRPQWGFSESPLIDGPLVVCTPGGNSGTVAAYNRMNGALAWRSSELKDPAGYASLVPIEIGKIPQYLVFTPESVAGVVARTGRLAWRAERKGRTAVIPTPLYKDGIVFVSSGYSVGCNAFQVGFNGRAFSVKEIYKHEEMANHHGGLVIVGDHVYGVDERQLKCIELKTGKVVWANPCVGKGSVAYADGHLVVRSERGPIAWVEATPAGYKEKGRFDQPERSGKEAWPHPVIFGGRLYIRDQDTLLAFNVSGKQ